jgi:elongation factor G
MPIFRTGNQPIEGPIGSTERLPSNLVTVLPDDTNAVSGVFVGIVDLIHMRAVIWPERDQRLVDNVDNCVPSIVNLLQPLTHEPIHEDCQVTELALEARDAFREALAEIDPTIEEYYLQDEEPSNAEMRAALRRVTLSRQAVPVLAAAALKGKGIEPLLDSIADLLPSPLDRLAPALHQLDENGKTGQRNNSTNKNQISLGHPRHNSALALAFKVVHMKGKGSGDGRVVFARVYSGQLKDRDQLQVITPPAPGEVAGKPRTERIGGMLELAGGRFDNVEGGVVKSGEVCALVGLKTVVTGDTLLLASESQPQSGKGKKSKTNEQGLVCLAGVASPKPVITVRLEAETSQEQKELSDALKLMSIEDPSLVVEETDSTTLLSGLGELHIEVVLDRLAREHGLRVMVGPPSVSYRETVKSEIESPGGLLNYDRTIGGTRLQAAVRLRIRPYRSTEEIGACDDGTTSCMVLSPPMVTIGPDAREFLGLNPDLSEEELIVKSEIARALIRGCEGALKRGPLQSAQMTNVVCHVEAVDAEGGLSSLKALPGALQAASAHAISTTLKEHSAQCCVLEPTMSVEVLLPNEMVGDVLSDLSNRRGLVGDVIIGEDSHSKALIRGDVPLSEILGYANSLRSLTGGEGAFTSEYKGHSPC